MPYALFQMKRKIKDGKNYNSLKERDLTSTSNDEQPPSSFKGWEILEEFEKLLFALMTYAW